MFLEEGEAIKGTEIQHGKLRKGHEFSPRVQWEGGVGQDKVSERSGRVLNDRLGNLVYLKSSRNPGGV